MEDPQLASSGPQTRSSNQTFMAGAAVVGVIAVLSAGALMYKKQTENAAAPQPTPAIGEDVIASPGAVGSPTIVSGEFKEGTFEAIGEYVSPGGPETVKVQLTLKADKISDITFTPQATLPTSVQFQGQFAEGYKGLVLGKKISEVSLDKVSGSSLTPKGFNDAIQKIMDQAKAS